MSLFPREQIMLGMELLRELIPDKNNEEKVVFITYPDEDTTFNSRLKGKSFEVPCIAHSINEEKLRSTDSVFSADSVTFYIPYTTLLSIDGLPESNFKNDNAILIYKNKNYIIEEEIETEMATGIRLHCNTKG